MVWRVCGRGSGVVWKQGARWGGSLFSFALVCVGDGDFRVWVGMGRYGVREVLGRRTLSVWSGEDEAGKERRGWS